MAFIIPSKFAKIFLKQFTPLLFKAIYSNNTYYGCGEQSHIKAECPNNEVKEKADFKKEKKGKAKKVYVAWDDNEVSSSSSSDDEEANITSTKCINNDYLFNAVLGLADVIQNVVAFLKLISFTNAAITNSRILKSKRMIYECGYL